MRNVKLPMPIFTESGDNIFEVEIKPITTGDLLEVKKRVNDGDYFNALKVFLFGSISKIGNSEDKEKIKRLVPMLPIQSAEFLSLEAMLLQYPEDDGIEGVYNCPRCGQPKICESKEDIDTRDFISELEIAYAEKDIKNEIMESVNVVVRDRVTNNLLLEVSNLTMSYPTLKDFIEASQKAGYKNDADIQKYVFVSCIKKINQVEDKKQVYKFGKRIIELTNPKELNKFSKEINKYGRDSFVKKVCNNCGKEWRARINTSNFFVSALG